MSPLPAGLKPFPPLVFNGPPVPDACDTVAETVAPPVFKDRFGRYEVMRREDRSLCELGRGAMGVTYKAFDARLRRTVALKVINAALLGGDATARQRFLREASSAAQLHHPHIATVFDISEEGGDDFYVMEFIEGEDLLTHLRRHGQVPVAFGLTVARQVAQALGAAWQQRVVHRDIKPANLMLARSPMPGSEGPTVVKVVDFGLAKALNASAGGSALVTQGSGFLGTAAYASPEQIEGGTVDIRSDLYSLGVTLWHLMAGQPTFGNTSLQQAISGHLAKPPPFADLRAVGLPEPVVTLLGALLEKDPDNRPGTPEELQREIEGITRTLGGDPDVTRAASAGPSSGTFAFAHGAASTLTPQPAAAMTVLRMSSPGASFPLVDVLRRRGSLRVGDVLALVDGLVPVVDACLGADAGLIGELSPATVHVQFASPPANLAALPGTPVDSWPPFLVHVRSREDADAASRSLGRTLLPSRGTAGKGAAVSQFAALVYELLSGAPPRPENVSPLPALNEEGNEILRRALTPPAFPTAAGFLRAMRDALGVSAPANQSRVSPPGGEGPSRQAPVVDGVPWTPAAVPERAGGGGVGAFLGKALVALTLLAGAGAGVRYWPQIRERMMPPATRMAVAAATPAPAPVVASTPAATAPAPRPVPMAAPTPRFTPRPTPFPTPTPVPTPPPPVNITVVMPNPPPPPQGGPGGQPPPGMGGYPPPPGGYPPPPPRRR